MIRCELGREELEQIGLKFGLGIHDLLKVHGPLLLRDLTQILLNLSHYRVLLEEMIFKRLLLFSVLNVSLGGDKGLLLSCEAGCLCGSYLLLLRG